METKQDRPLTTPSPGMNSTGANNDVAEINGERIPLYLYRPIGASNSKALLLFDGMHRNAPRMRDKAIYLSEHTGMTVIAPLFEQQRFPNWRYARAGVINQRKIQPREEWTAPILQALVDWTHCLFTEPTSKVSLFGHSAGGQLLSRVCAYSSLSRVERVIVANPSTYVLPALHERAPFGFKGIFSEEEAILKLRDYLATPLTIYLGQEDKEERNLDKSAAALRQGSNRLNRGRFTYRTALGMAKALKIECNWRLTEVPGAGHSSRAMLAARQILEVLE